MSGLRLMIVEDEALIALLLEDLLAELGCQVVASFGRLSQARDWLARQADPPDAALLDVNLGGELVFPLADDLARRRIPFAFATAYAVVRDPRFAMAPVVRKPLTAADLAQVVAGLQAAA